MEYDTKGRVYVCTSRFRPLFDFPAERVLTWLSQGYGDSEPIRRKSVVAREGTSLPGKLDLDLLSGLTRAIHPFTKAPLSRSPIASCQVD